MNGRARDSGVHSINIKGVRCLVQYLPWARYTFDVSPARFRINPAVLMSGQGKPETARQWFFAKQHGCWCWTQWALVARGAFLTDCNREEYGNAVSKCPWGIRCRASSNRHALPGACPATSPHHCIASLMTPWHLESISLVGFWTGVNQIGFKI